MTRERAESIVRDLVASGEVAKGQANKAADWLVERGRAGTDELAETIRREIRQQVSALGLATKEDLARLEAQVEELRAPAAMSTPSPPVTSAVGTTKSAGISRSGSVRKRTGKTAAASPTGSSEPGAAPPPGGADSPKG